MAGSVTLESGTYIDPKDILQSKDTLRGVGYLNSSLKRRLDMVLGDALSVGVLVPLAVMMQIFC